MADFYASMKAMASSLLAPTSAGGLGQTGVSVTITIVGAPANPWEEGTTTTTTETLKAAARGVSEKLVGTDYGGTVLLASDIQITCSPIGASIKAGDGVTVNGRSMQILGIENIPAAGDIVAQRLIVRG